MNNALTKTQQVIRHIHETTVRECNKWLAADPRNAKSSRKHAAILKRRDDAARLLEEG